MLTFLSTQPLAEYFHNSARFYYAVIDLEGNFVYVNPLLQQQLIGITANPYGKQAITIFSEAAREKFQFVIEESIRNPGMITQAELDMRVGSSVDQPQMTSWEFSANTNEEGIVENIQAIGFRGEEPGYFISRPGDRVDGLAERYNAYEHSAEGLWMFETSEPVSARETPEEILAFWKINAHLAACNDNTARMYGFDKAEELAGIPLNQLIDFDDLFWIGNLKSFIQKGFKSTGVETKEFDRYGNTHYFLNNMEGVVEGGMLKRVWGTKQDITEKKKAEEELIFQAGLYSNISDAISSSDMEFKITSWNKGAEEIYGLPAAEVFGKRLIDLIAINYHKTTREEVIKTIFDKGIWKGEVSFIRKSDQTLRTILASITLQHDGNGKRVGVVAINKDITERKKTEDQLRQQATILSNVSDLIFTTDFNHTILSWNKKAEEVVGYSAAETIGKSLEDIVRPDYNNSSQKQSSFELNEKGFWQGEVTFLSKAGAKKNILHTSTYLLDEVGERVAVICTGKDITERKQAEEQLQHSELFYRNLFANSLDGVLLTDEEGMIIFASPSITPILGFTSDEVIGKNAFDFAHPDDREFAFTSFRDDVASDPKLKFISVRLLKKTGDWIWCIMRGHNLMQNPFVKGIVIYFYDDTMRKETEAALIESEKRFRYQATVLNNVTDIIVTRDMNRVVTSWNNVVEKLSGISEKEAIGKLIQDILPTDYSPYTNDQVIEIVFREGIWRGELSFTGRSGEKIYLLHTISILYNDEGHPIGLLGVGKDITERKKAEAMLQESEQFYRNMSYYSFDGVIMSDKTGKITYCGPSVKKITGYEPADVLGHNFFEFIHPDDTPIAMDAFTKVLNKQSEVNYILLRLKHANGEWTWCTVRGHNLLDTHGFNAVVVYFTNDTKRKQAEDSLRQSEEEFRNLIQNLRQGVVVHNAKGELIACNRASQNILGLSENDLMGATSYEFRWNTIHEDGSDFPGYAHPGPEALRTKKPVRDAVMGVLRPTTGARVWLLVNADPTFDNSGNLINVIITFTDITEQKRLAKELFEQEVQKQKLLIQATIDGQEKERQQIGKELHDNINQHLTTIRLYLEVAKEKASDEVLEMINLSHKTLASIIGEIRLLSQSLVPPTLGDLGLVESVQDLCDSLKRAHKFNIEFYARHFREEYLPENMKLMLFRITQEQVNNILRHAQAGSIQIKLQSDAEYIILTISDDGKGFDPAHYKKGLGLTNITNRAGLFNGKVEIDAAPGKGCHLTVIIPLETSNGTYDLI